MYFSILGALSVWKGDQQLALGGAKRQALLSLLLLHANEPVAADTLIECLWGDDRPDAAAATLQSHISQLRKVLGPGRVETAHGGYRLSVDRSEVDSWCFEAELSEGRERLQAGEYARAVALLESALGRWRGSPLASVNGEVWASGVISRLVQLRVAAIEALLDAKLRLGGHHDAVGIAEAAISEHPVQEALWGQLMLALYRSGRQAEALQTYQRLRRTLVEELGLEPTPPLAQLEQAILRHDPELEWRPPATVPADGGPQARPPEGGTDPDVAGALPFPPRLAASPASGFVGRVRERQRLQHLLKDVLAGQRRVALLAGEPGIGKTRLASVVAHEAEETGAGVLYGFCSEDLGAPYEPFIESLRYLAAHLPGHVLESHAAAHGDVVVRLVPELARRLPQVAAMTAGDPETERYLLFRAVADLLAVATSSRPLLLVLDDLHWADKPTLLLLRFLLEVEPGPAMLVIGTYRQSDLSRRHPLVDVLAALRRNPSVERIPLGGLDDLEVLELVESTLGGRLDDGSTSVVHAMGRETDGNPFFAGELLRHLTESGGLRRGDDGRLVLEGATLAHGFPDSVREVIGRRIDRLGEGATEALTAASVIGRDFDLGLLAAVLNADEEELLGVLEQATSAGLLTSVIADRFSFVHALAEHALYEELSPSRRVRLHRRVAESLEARATAGAASRPAELAYHWSRTPELAKAVACARAAGSEALSRLGPEEASRWFQQALELLGSQPVRDDAMRCTVMIDLGEAQRQAGDPAHRETLLAAAQLARSLGDTPALVKSALANHRGDMSSAGHIDHERVAVLEEALGRMEPADTASHALLLATLASELQWAPDWQRRLALSDTGLAMARRVGDPTVLATVLSARHEAIRVPPTLEERLDNTAELLHLARRLGDPRQRGYAALWRAHSSWERGDVAEVDRCMRIVQEEAPRAGAPYLEWNLAAHRANRAVIDGRLDDAEHLAHEAFRIAEGSGQPDALDVLVSQLFVVKSNQGRLQEIRPLVDRAAAASPSVATYRLAQALLREDQGVEEIHRRLEAEAADGFTGVPYNKEWLTDLAGLSTVCLRLGALGPAAVVFDLMAPWSDQVMFSGSAVTGSVARPVAVLAALLERWVEADAFFEEAAACHQRMGAAVFLARTQVDWARMLLDRDESANSRKARGLLIEALETSREVGLGPVERRAGALLSRLAG